MAEVVRGWAVGGAVRKVEEAPKEEVAQKAVAATVALAVVVGLGLAGVVEGS